MKRWAPLLALAALSLLWGYTWVLAKLGLNYVGPFTFALQRSVGGAAAMLLVLALLRRPLGLRFPARTFWIGATQTGGFMIFQTWALVEGGPGKTAVLIFTMPIWTLLLAWPLLGERVRGGQWLAALSTLAGLLLVISPWDMHTSLFSKALGIGAALMWAIGTILVKRLRGEHEIDLLNLTTWQMVFGALVVAAASGFVHEAAVQWNAQFIAILLFMTLISTCLCWVLWLYILGRLPAWEASLSVLGTPVIAIVSSRWQTGESFSLQELAGILLIGAGLGLLSLLGWRASRRAAALTSS